MISYIIIVEALVGKGVTEKIAFPLEKRRAGEYNGSKRTRRRGL